MKWVGYSILLAIFMAAVAWWAVQSAAPPHPTQAAAGAPLPAAPYPPGMWQQIARLTCPGNGAVTLIEQASGAALPPHLDWQTGETQPPLGSAQARKGGTVRLCSVGPAFPTNLLAFGSPTPQFFHTNAFERVELPLVQQSPGTHGILPGVACAWAVQNRTVYFRLHPAARYTNGRPVRAADYALGALLRAKAGADGAWAALCREAEALRIYDERTLALTLRRTAPLQPLRAAALLHAAEPGFYTEAVSPGCNYAEKYAWRIPPTTGAYTIGRIERGRLIALRRVPHWWAEDLPHYRSICNADEIEYHFLADEAQAWEFLLNGKLDALQTRHIAAWHRYADRVESRGLLRRCFMIESPLPPYGIALNARRLPSVELRRGLLHAMDMQRAITVLFRGEGEQLRTFSAGYGSLSPQHTPQRSYSPAEARACFARAGYTEAGEDGILRRADGSRLSFPLSFVPSEKVSALVALLAESAAACGAEIVPEPLSWQSCAAKVREGSHFLTFWATVPPAVLPEPARYLHSRATGDEAPFLPDSNEMDAALAACNAAQNLPELAQALAHVDRLVYDLAIWLPGWMERKAYLVHSPRLCFPDTPGFFYDVTDNHTFWLRENADNNTP